MRLTSLSLLALLMAGCAVGNPRAHTWPSAAAQPGSDAATSSYLKQVRELDSRVRPPATDALVAETWSQDLAAAIARHAVPPTPESEVDLAQAYVRAGILDQAHEHFAAAARLDPHNGAAWDGLARIWRDWGFPHIGLGDAYRAVWAAPGSPSAHNTLGTILQCLGNGGAAREQFAQALAGDGGAAYAHNNLCYSWLMEADATAAAIACGRALSIDPGLVPARNNLALASAMNGDLAGAAEIFQQVGGEAAAQYNLGIVHLSLRHYVAAADAFDRAADLDPSLLLARARARHARQQAVGEPVGEGGNLGRR